MCSIIGWNNRLDKKSIDYIIKTAKTRGRDGWGFWIDGKEYRGLGEIPNKVINRLYKGKKVLGNFRATPTTEEESSLDNLQPYQGIVHNGTIANDKKFGDYEIDSMILPKVFKNIKNGKQALRAIKKIKGSFALAFFIKNSLILAVNYKPIYYGNIKKSFVFASQKYMLPCISEKQKPYTIYEINKTKKNIYPLIKSKNKKVLLACSGGLDSTTVAYMLKNQGYRVTLVYFVYNCLAEKKEYDRVLKISKHGKFKLKKILMPNVLSGTIVEGKYNKTKKGIKGTEYAMDWVSARNLLMLSILTADAEKNGYSYISFGGNLEESGAYPDNEEEFGNQFNNILPYSTQNGVRIELLQPLATYMKHEIIKIGSKLKVPYEYTWSCYGNGKAHCQECGPCYMRKKAFNRNGLKDPVML